MSLPQPHARRGFTLTELLVVIAIIAILASLGGVAIMTALNRARATAIKTELDQIDAAMKRYKDTYGSYPPCNLAFLDTSVNAAEQSRRRQIVKQHLAMAFPRYNASGIDAANNKEKLENDLKLAGLDLENVRPDQALVFWLQGFSADPMNPILSINGKQIVNNAEVGNPQKRTNNFFEFDETRLAGQISGTVTNPAPSYFPANARLSVNNVAAKRYQEYVGGTPPIVYFDSRWYEETAPVVGGTSAQPHTFNGVAPPIFADAGVVAPYWHDRNNNFSTNQAEDRDSQEGWVNPDSFQLIASGSDNKYGPSGVPLPINAHLFPTGTNWDLNTEEDNATNFSASAKLGDDLP